MSRTFVENGYPDRGDVITYAGTTPESLWREVPKGGLAMGRLTTLFVKLREFHKNLSRGQTMTEYALILAAIAVVGFAAYLATGQDINALVTWNQIDKDLTNAL